MEGRPARDINKLIGEDLAFLRPVAICHDCELEEEARVREKFQQDKKSMTMRPCTFYLEKGKCSKGDRCDYLHLNKSTI